MSTYYSQVYDGLDYDLVVDSEKNSSHEIAIQIKNFIEKRFSVKVVSLRTAIFSRSQKNRKNGKSMKSYFKKVYVKLDKGMKIPLFEGV